MVCGLQMGVKDNAIYVGRAICDPLKPKRSRADRRLTGIACSVAPITKAPYEFQLTIPTYPFVSPNPSLRRVSGIIPHIDIQASRASQAHRTGHRL